VQIVAAGSAAQVHQSTVAFYIGVGFAALTDSVLNRGNRQITLVVENRDHSATQTNLVIGVTTR
jgi:16S rRNA A1518/A1519 N6-dimethyltransferase RsmA/KsgA/DIM1 with predicted DNA glycosylase/AP lyase activity